MSAVSSTSNVINLNGQPAVVADNSLPPSCSLEEHSFNVLSDEDLSSYAQYVRPPTIPLTPIALPPDVIPELTAHQKCIQMHHRLKKNFLEQTSSKTRDDLDIGRKKRIHFLADVDLSSQTRHFTRLQTQRQKYDELMAFVNNQPAALSDHNAQAITDLEQYFLRESLFSQPVQRKNSSENSSPRTGSPSPLNDVTTAAMHQIGETIRAVETTDAPEPHASFIIKMRVVQIAAVVALVAGIVLGFTVNRKFFALAYAAYEIGAAAWHVEKGALAGKPYTHGAEIFKISPALRLLNWVFFSQIKKPFIPPAQNLAGSTLESGSTEVPRDSTT